MFTMLKYTLSRYVKSFHNRTRLFYHSGSDGYERFSKDRFSQFKFENDGNFRHKWALSSARRYLWYMVGLTGIGGAVYYTTHLEKVPISGRTRFMNVGEHREKVLGDMAFNSMMEQVGHSILPSYHPLSIYVKKITDRLLYSIEKLSDELGGQLSTIAPSNYEVYVVDSPIPNAMVLPSGQIFVFTGIIPIAQNEAGLATVLSHEISHKLLRHHAERLSLYSVFIYLGIVLQLLIPGSDFRLLNDLIVRYGIMLPNSRKTELEADRVGLMLMSLSCYMPQESISFWKRMDQHSMEMEEHRIGRGNISEYLSTHPTHRKRMEQINELLPEAMEKRQSAGCEESKFLSSFRRFVPIS